jgi:hypothetical protein
MIIVVLGNLILETSEITDRVEVKAIAESDGSGADPLNHVAATGALDVEWRAAVVRCGEPRDGRARRRGAWRDHERDTAGAPDGEPALHGEVALGGEHGDVV